MDSIQAGDFFLTPICLRFATTFKPRSWPTVKATESSKLSNWERNRYQKRKIRMCYYFLNVQQSFHTLTATGGYGYVYSDHVYALPHYPFGMRTLFAFDKVQSNHRFLHCCLQLQTSNNPLCANGGCFSRGGNDMIREQNFNFPAVLFGLPL
jgi:hypothetical protein